MNLIHLLIFTRNSLLSYANIQLINDYMKYQGCAKWAIIAIFAHSVALGACNAFWQEDDSLTRLQKTQQGVVKLKCFRKEFRPTNPSRPAALRAAEGIFRIIKGSDF